MWGGDREEDNAGHLGRVLENVNCGSDLRTVKNKYIYATLNFKCFFKCCGLNLHLPKPSVKFSMSKKAS